MRIPQNFYAHPAEIFSLENVTVLLYSRILSFRCYSRKLFFDMKIQKIN
jgi:hypothetical protein